MIVKTKHQPNKYGSYVEIHTTVMEKFRAQGFIGSDNLLFESFLLEGFRLRGQIACLGGIVITVDKFIEILEHQGSYGLVQTKWYTYNVSLRGGNNIFRYDNQDKDYLRPGHQDEHHKHVFNPWNGCEIPNSPEWIGLENWPTLGEIIKESQDWYWQHREILNLPDVHGALDDNRL